jgi:hypothetical protein
MTSLYAHAGGEEAVHRLEKLFYSKVLADPLLGQGPLLFEGLPPEHIELDLVRTLEAPGVVHLRYEVRRA